jgi:hypothetical protein
MNSIPELDGLDRKEKRKLFRQMYREGRKRTGMVPYLYFIIAAVLIGVASVFFGARRNSQGRIRRWDNRVGFCDPDPVSRAGRGSRVVSRHQWGWLR